MIKWYLEKLSETVVVHDGQDNVTAQSANTGNLPQPDHNFILEFAVSVFGGIILGQNGEAHFSPRTVHFLHYPTGNTVRRDVTPEENERMFFRKSQLVHQKSDSRKHQKQIQKDRGGGFFLSKFDETN